MPPPKKPKNGPTTVEQFLSHEELQKMEEAGLKTVESNISVTSCPDGRVSIASNRSQNAGNANQPKSSAVLSTTSPASHQSRQTAAVSGSEVGELENDNTVADDSCAPRTGLLRQLFAKQDSGPAAPLHHVSISDTKTWATSSSWAGNFRPSSVNSIKALFSSGLIGSSKTVEPQITDSGDNNRPTSQSTSRILFSSTSLADIHQLGSGNTSSSSSSNSRPGPEMDSSSKAFLEPPSYLTSLSKESAPPSSATLSAAYLERVSLNHPGKVSHGLAGSASPPFLHAAFQQPLSDTSTLELAMSDPISTSVFAYLAGQGPLLTSRPPSQSSVPLSTLPQSCEPSPLPLVDNIATSVTSLISSASSGTRNSSASTQGLSNEPFDLSIKKTCPASGSSSVDKGNNNGVHKNTASSGAGSNDKTTPELASRSGSSSSAGISSSSFYSSTSSSTIINANTSESPSATPLVQGGDCNKDGSSPKGHYSGVITPPYLMDFPRGNTLASSSFRKHFMQDSLPSTAGAAASAVRHFLRGPGPSPATPPSPGREPSDCKPVRGDNHGHNRLASGGPGPGPGAGPEGGGSSSSGGVGPGPGMPSPSLMTSTGHLQQAATSTTPEGGGGGTALQLTFLSMESHPSLGPGDIHIKQEISAGSSTPAKLCQVCNDNASGFHYGVWSCEGCKAFFKRSIQGPVDYMCPATNNCTIDKHRRKSCQACRLRKCYEVGMNKGSQRKERKSSVGGGGGGVGKGKRCRADSTDSSINSTNGGASASKCVKRARCASILEALQKADLPVLESYHNHEQPPSRVHLLNTLIKLADRELVYLINWAKHVPGYTDLSLSDQVHLIECCWMELLLLNCAFRSMDHEGKRLVFAPDFHLDRHLWNVTGMTEILEQVAAVSEQMVQFGVSKEELLLLQATVLVNAEVRRLASYGKIGEMRQMLVDALLEVSQRTHPDNSRHVPSLLLLLTHIRQAGDRGIAYFQTLKREGCVTFCDLLTEMLEAHTAPASAVTTTSATISVPSTSTGDRKNISPSQLAVGGVTKRGSQDDATLDPFV